MLSNIMKYCLLTCEGKVSTKTIANVITVLHNLRKVKLKQKKSCDFLEYRS